MPLNLFGNGSTRCRLLIPGGTSGVPAELVQKLVSKAVSVFHRYARFCMHRTAFQSLVKVKITLLPVAVETLSYSPQGTFHRPICSTTRPQHVKCMIAELHNTTREAFVVKRRAIKDRPFLLQLHLNTDIWTVPAARVKYIGKKSILF